MFCQEVMLGVVRTGCVNDTNKEKAVEIMREEAKAFFTEPKYQEARECVMNGTIDDRYVMANIITECVSRILE